MTYQEKLVAVVKCRGKILREHGEFVTIPFGEEYTILLKNLESRRVLISVSIDGQDILNGTKIILEPNSSTELEGFLEGMKVRNKFKFIKKTKQISDFRGDKVDDGIIRIEYNYEKRVEKREVIVEEVYHYRCSPRPFWCNGRCWGCNYNCYPPYPFIKRSWNYNYDPVVYGSGGPLGSSGNIGSTVGGNLNDGKSSMTYTANLTNTGAMNSAESKITSNFNSVVQDSFTPLQDEGITVKGSESNQQFNYGYIGTLEEQSHVIILRLRGTDSKGVEVKETIEVKKKLRCTSCGRTSRSSSKFCPGCGTSLI